MNITESCIQCLWRRQQRLSDDPEYLSEVKKILDNHKDDDCLPYLVFLFNETYEKRFGKRPSYNEQKKLYNDLVLSMESSFRRKIQNSADPLKTAFTYARSGNYIDFGAISNVDTDTFMNLLDNSSFAVSDESVYKEFIKECKKSKSFLLIADNCGEIVLDKLFLEQLHSEFPQLKISVMVRGADVLNDVTVEDANYSGIDKIAKIISSGSSVAGIIFELISDEAKKAISAADVILAKGQGNYESLSGHGNHIYFSFLCKCDLFINRFHVPKYTGMFISE